MIKIKLLKSGKILLVENNKAHDLIDGGEAELYFNKMMTTTNIKVKKGNKHGRANYAKQIKDISGGN